jgi:hypothetical protein
LGWAFKEKPAQPDPQYERLSVIRKKRSSPQALLLTEKARHQMLQEWGFTKLQIFQASKNNEKMNGKGFGTI